MPKLNEEQQLALLEEIGTAELEKLRQQYPFYNTIITDGFEPEPIVKAYSLLNTYLMGITYFHSPMLSVFAIREIKYVIEYAPNYLISFETIEKAEEYIRKTKRKNLQNIFETQITREYYDLIKDMGYSTAEDFSQLKYLEKPVKLKKTVIESVNNLF